ncbi:MAG: hypothetical protein KAI57_04950 [Candidatus Pacebacteria bacterium]|nr:hypothetical protein [Candidatus Paceibacterota bacterium]
MKVSINDGIEEIEAILNELQSEEIIHVVVAGDGIFIESEGVLNKSRITSELSIAFLSVEDSVNKVLLKDAAVNMRTTRHIRNLGNLFITIKRAGPTVYIIVLSKSIVAGSYSGLLCGDRNIGGTYKKIDDAANRIAGLL